MKKKLIGLLLTMICVVSLVACGGDDGNSDGGNSDGGSNAQAGTTSSGYTFDYKGVSISVGTDIETILDKIGEPSSLFEDPSCAGQGTDFVYRYSGVDIYTSPSKDSDKAISTILIVSDEVETPEGITIGSTQEDVEAAYGTDYSESNGMLTYEKGGMKLGILIKGGVVDSIQYTTGGSN